jgi:hypothetical protein
MTYNDFAATLTAAAVPPSLPPLLQALWLDYHEQWNDAHEIAQANETDPNYCWLHAYLHRREGDEWNAGYWYRRGKMNPFAGTLKQEWETLAQAFTKK